MVVLGAVNLHFQGQGVPISLRPLLRTVAVMSCLQCGHHVVKLLFPLGVSVSMRQLAEYGPEYYL